MNHFISRRNIVIIYLLAVTACSDAVETATENNIDVKPPNTAATATPEAAIVNTLASMYAGNQAPIQISLRCNDDKSGCNTYYSTDPDQAENKFSKYEYDPEQKIPITETTTLRFYSIDYAGHIENTKTRKYIIDYAPAVKNSEIAFTISDSIMDIFWAPAEDAEPDPGTSQAALTYQLYYADTNVFSTLSNIPNPALATAVGS